MGIIIGFMTQAEVNGTCAISASWNMSANTQRLYCLSGNFEPTHTINKATQSANLTCYAPSSSVTVSPSTACDTHDAVCTVGVTISPGSCAGGGVNGLSGNFMPTSYSYNKEDTTLPGQESWSLQKFVGDNIPSNVIRGIAEGSATDESVCGVTFMGDTTDGYSGNISAGGAVGRADTMKVGTVSAVGGGQGTSSETGQASVSIPYTPLWLS